MSTPDKLLEIFWTLLIAALGFGWGWIIRAIYEKDKREDKE